MMTSLPWPCDILIQFNGEENLEEYIGRKLHQSQYTLREVVTMLRGFLPCHKLSIKKMRRSAFPHQGMYPYHGSNGSHSPSGGGIRPNDTAKARMQNTTKSRIQIGVQRAVHGILMVLSTFKHSSTA